MTKKYWAIIIANRPRIYALGSHDHFDKAEALAVDYCNKKNEENLKEYDALPQGTEAPEPAPLVLAYIMDESDLRVMIGDVHRPLVIARRREVAADAPTKHGSEPED